LLVQARYLSLSAIAVELFAAARNLTCGEKHPASQKPLHA
jgi:hypothetical protein